MVSAMFKKSLFKRNNKIKASKIIDNLAKAKLNSEYIIKSIETEDEDIKNFLFSLGCYKGEIVTVISILAENYVISVKDARYSIDKDLAEAILV